MKQTMNKQRVITLHVTDEDILKWKTKSFEEFMEHKLTEELEEEALRLKEMRVKDEICRKLNSMVGDTFLINFNNMEYLIFQHNIPQVATLNDTLRSGSPILSITKIDGKERIGVSDFDYIKVKWLFGMEVMKTYKIPTSAYKEIYRKLQFWIEEMSSLPNFNTICCMCGEELKYESSCKYLNDEYCEKCFTDTFITKPDEEI